MRSPSATPIGTDRDAVSESFDTEVAIVGGGPAGAALQIRLAAAGVESVLFERSTEPRWRACGVFSSPLTRGRLADLGLSVDDIAQVAKPIPALNLRTLSGATCRLEYGTEAGPACGFDRLALDAHLLHAASNSGPSPDAIHLGRVVKALTIPQRAMDRVRLTVSPTTTTGNSAEWRARLVVGADGPRSIVARTAGVTRSPRVLRKAGITFHEKVDASQDGGGNPDDGSFLLGDDWYVGVAPVPNGRVNVGIVVPASYLASGLGEAIARTRGAMLSTPGGDPSVDRQPTVTDEVVAALPLRHRVTAAAGTGFVLVGDACGFVDPLTGEGLHRALVSSELAAEAIHRWSRGAPDALGVYDRRLRSRFRNKDVVSWILQVFLAQPALLDYAVRRLASRKRQREVLTRVLTDQLPASRALEPSFLLRLLAP
jgi:flavin-dependent dehydrogenase